MMKILKAVWAFIRRLFRRKSPLKISREEWRGFVKGFNFDQQPSGDKPGLYAAIMRSKGF